MLDDDSQIALIHHDRVPAILLDEFCASVNVDSLSFKRISQPEPGPQAGLEWLAFPVIAVFLLKPYFDGFMKEAGKDHYLILKNALKALWGKLFSRDRTFRIAIVTVSGEKKLKYSMLFAIYASVDNDQLVKLLIREGCSEDEYSESIDAFLNLVESYHSRKPNEKQVVDPESKENGEKITLIEYDGKKKCLRIVDPRAESGSHENSDD